MVTIGVNIGQHVVKYLSILDGLTAFRAYYHAIHTPKTRFKQRVQHSHQWHS